VEFALDAVLPLWPLRLADVLLPDRVFLALLSPLMSDGYADLGKVTSFATVYAAVWLGCGVGWAVCSIVDRWVPRDHVGRGGGGVADDLVSATRSGSDHR
jgi:membrane protein DedA with SNARE-associated domain